MNHRSTVNMAPGSTLSSSLFPTDEHGRIVLQDPASVGARGKSSQYPPCNDRAHVHARHGSTPSVVTVASPTSPTSSRHYYERPHHRHSHSYASPMDVKQESISPVQPGPSYHHDPSQYPPQPGSVHNPTWHNPRYSSVPPGGSQQWGHPMPADAPGYQHTPYDHSIRGSSYDAYASEQPLSSGPIDNRSSSSVPPSYDSPDRANPHGDQSAAGQAANNGGVKRRRRSTQYQLQILNAAYAESRYPSTLARQELAKKLNMTPRQVQIWFQNKRGYAME